MDNDVMSSHSHLQPVELAMDGWQLALQIIALVYSLVLKVH